LELIKDYDLTIRYHPRKANVIADALSQKSEGSLAALKTQQSILLGELERIQLNVQVRELGLVISWANQVSIQYDLYDRIKEAQQKDDKIRRIL